MATVDWIAVYGPAGGIIIVLIYFVKRFSDMYQEACRERITRHSEELVVREENVKMLMVLIRDKVDVDKTQASAYDAIATAIENLARRIESVERRVESSSRRE